MTAPAPKAIEALVRKERGRLIRLGRLRLGREQFNVHSDGHAVVVAWTGELAKTAMLDGAEHVLRRAGYQVDRVYSASYGTRLTVTRTPVRR